MKSSLLVLMMLFSALPSSAAIRETLVLTQAPSESELAAITRMPGARDIRITLEDPTPAELERLMRLPGTGSIEIRSMGFPSQGDLGFWKDWASEDRGEVMFLSSVFPTQSEMDRLVSIGLRRWSLAFASYPASTDIRRLNAMASRPRLIFMSGRYPSPVEQTPLLGLAKDFPVEVVSKQWTRYVHMDFLNRMPQRKWLTIWDVYPSASDLTYLEVVRDLDRLVIEADFDPASPEMWSKLARYPLVWVRTGSMPTDSQLQAIDRAFSAGSRFQELVLRLGRPLTARERSRLEALTIPVDLRIDFQNR